MQRSHGGRNARANVTGKRLAVAFNAWRWTATDDYDADEWKPQSAQWWPEGAQSHKHHSLKIDRRKQWETIAGDAQHAADRGDTRELDKTRTETRSLQAQYLE